ncbi:Fork head domain protein [Trichostrongylus colubriformis]|uniref:Fork head domain protein n=1 Tax=Trichostrongylus colubriformis TaxID=6319 RepID=A0AAN8IEJ8_TRICO
MLSEAQRPPADPSGATENLLMLAIQERLQNQFRPSSNQAATAANLFNHQINLNQSWATQDVNRLFQQMLPLLGLPPLLPGLPGPLDLGCLPGTSVTHPLWQHNLCAWPECNHPCENLAVFLNHLSQAHTFNERSTSDMRVQVELVDSLEHRLTKERNRLQAMMQHLHMKQSPDTTTPALGKVEHHSSPLRSPKQETPSFTTISSLSSTQTQPVQSSLPSVSLSISEAATTPLSIAAPSVVSSEGSPNSNDVQSQKTFVPRRSRISDKSVLPISADIARNREFYRTNDVRPPYTYASLIRQAIMESPECQLTLNEIYT